MNQANHRRRPGTLLLNFLMKPAADLESGKISSTRLKALNAFSGCSSALKINPDPEIAPK